MTPWDDHISLNLDSSTEIVALILTMAGADKLRRSKAGASAALCYDPVARMKQTVSDLNRITPWQLSVVFADIPGSLVIRCK
jgi:hypothetical protein